VHLPPFSNEPICNYEDPARFEAAKQAIRAAPLRFSDHYPAIIGGHRVETSKRITSVSPARPDLALGTVARCGQEHVDQAIAAAQDAYATWSKAAPDERADKVLNLAALLRQRRFELLALLCYEIGKDWYEADAEIAEAIDFCEYYARLALVPGPSAPLARLAQEDNTYHYIPLGVGVVISPWNFPLAILTGMTMAAVVAGNTVLVKPSSDTPVIAARLFAMAEEAGFPPGVLNLVPGSGGEIGDDMVTRPEVRFAAFTGSADVGLRINELIARPDPRRKWMTRYVSEMGGKNAIIVDDTADLEAAARGVVRSAFGFQGQKCSACSRLVVDHRVKDQLLELIMEKTMRLPVADPWEDCCVFTGPVANQGAFRDILKAIETGRSEARLVLGGKPIDREGYFIEPTIFDGVASGGFLGQEEIFGPVLGVITVGSFDEALRVGNDTRYGLTGAVYSRSPERLERARREFHVGNLYLNRGCTGALVGVHPFGGFNLSGTDSKAGGPDYLLNFTQGRTVSEHVTVLRTPGLGT
jgi:1-pyrroline-5-carboxylate dehydrogenase